MKKRAKKKPFAGKPSRPPKIKWHRNTTILQVLFADEQQRHRPTRDIIAQYAYWIDDEHLADPGLLAIAEVDRTGSVDPLIDFLRSRKKLTPFGRKRIADYLERTKPGKRGRKRTPDYDLTDAENSLDMARAELSERVAAGVPLDQAMVETEQELGVPVAVQKAMVDRKHASARRAEKREAALKSGQ